MLVVSTHKRFLDLRPFFRSSIEIELAVGGIQYVAKLIELEGEFMQHEAHALDLGIKRIEGDQSAVILTFEPGLIFGIIEATHMPHTDLKAVELVAALPRKPR